MDPKHKKEIRIKHENDASQNATTSYFLLQINDYVQLVQNATIHDELNSLILTSTHVLNLMLIHRE